MGETLVSALVRAWVFRLVTATAGDYENMSVGWFCERDSQAMITVFTMSAYCPEGGTRGRWK